MIRRLLLCVGTWIAVCTATPVAAQSASAPDAADRSSPDSSFTIVYETGGVRVVHRRIASSDIVVANLYLLGGVRQLTHANAGIETLLLQLGERGTRAYPKEQLRRTMARLGTSIVVDAETDWSSIGVRATRATFDSTWAVLASRVQQPLWDSTEFDIIKRQFVAGVRQRQDSPDALLEFLADSFAFANHAYALSPVGTESSLSRLALADLRRYHAEQIVKSRLLLVIVGNITRDRVERLVSQTIARLPQGAYQWTLPDTLPHAPSAVHVVDRPLPTNYIMGRYAGPPAGSKDYQALRLATAVLSGQLFSEVRSRRNLTYAVDAPFIERAVAAGGLYVTTVSPDITLEAMRQQLTALKTGYLNEDGLQRLVNQFITQYFLDNESHAAQADFLARAFLYQGDVQAVDRFEAELRAVSPDDIRRAVFRYMKDIRFVYIGDASRVPKRVMERF